MVTYYKNINNSEETQKAATSVMIAGSADDYGRLRVKKPN